jgi:hypothetical protein
MKNILIFIVFAISFYSCNTTFNQFYSAHKTDMGTTSFQMPNFIKGTLTVLAPETKTILDHILDFKYIKFENINDFKRQVLVNEMNEVTTGGYSDMYRKNETNHIRILSVKEKGTKVTDFIIFNSTNNETTAFYLRGNFDPLQIKSLLDETNYSEFTQQLIQSYQSNLKIKANPNN